MGAYHRKYAIETRSLSCEQAADSVAQYFFFPETKGLSLEEMDVLFGSVGAAAADTERMREIAREIGLDQVVKGDSISSPGMHEPKVLDEKVGTQTREHGSESD